jgi:predicted nucleic acid-binding protein
MKVLADSDFLFGLFVPTDAHFWEAKKLWGNVVKNGTEVIVLNLVVQEVATVLSHKVNQALAISFVEKFSALGTRVMVVDGEIEDFAWKIFLGQKKKGTSFVDCANLAAIEKYKLDGIVTFDEFYPVGLRIK